MVEGCILPDKTFAILDGDSCYIFDMVGRFKSKGDITANVIMNKKQYKAISVLSCSGDVEIAVFDSDGVFKKTGNSQSAMTLLSQRGFVRRLQRSGTEQGIKFTQMVFIYNTDVNVKERI